MPDQLHGQIRTQARPTIALLTPKQQDHGQAEVVVVQNLQLRMAMLQLHRATIRIRLGIHKCKLIDHLQDEVYRKRLFLSLLWFRHMHLRLVVLALTTCVILENHRLFRVRLGV